MTEKKRQAKLDNWFVTPQKDNPNAFVLRGNVDGHEGNTNINKEDGLHTTSPIKMIDFEKGIAVSQNTEYTLGKGAELQPAPAAA